MRVPRAAAHPLLAPPSEVSLDSGYLCSCPCHGPHRGLSTQKTIAHPVLTPPEQCHHDAHFQRAELTPPESQGQREASSLASRLWAPPGPGQRSLAAGSQHLYQEASFLPAWLLPCPLEAWTAAQRLCCPPGVALVLRQPRVATSEASKGACKMPDCYSTCRLGRANFWNQGVEGLVRGGHGHTSPDVAAPREQDRGSSLCMVADVMSARSSVRRN